MKHLILSLLFALTAALAVSAQNRVVPELELPPIEHKAADDTLNFEERPYFLLIDQCEQALREQKYDDAALRLIEAMSVEPRNPLNVALMSNLGMIYYYNEQDSLALATLDEAIRRSPRLVSTHKHRARVLLGMGRDDDAYDEYSTIIGIDSINTDARFYRGMMSLYRGKLETARADFAVLNKLIPLTRQTTLANATLNAMTGNNLEAASGFRKLLSLEKLPEYYAQLAGCLIALDDLGEASKVLGEGLSMYPEDAELYYYRAKLNHLRYQEQDAIADAKRAIQLGADAEHVAAIFEKK